MALCLTQRWQLFRSLGQSIRAHDKEPIQEFFKLSSISMPSTHSGTKGKWHPGHGLRSPISQKTGVQILFGLSPYMYAPYPVNSDPTSKSPENGFISFCSHYMRIWVNDYSCLWGILGVTMTEHTCCGFRRSFMIRIHHLPPLTIPQDPVGLGSENWLSFGSSSRDDEFWLKQLSATCWASFLVFFCCTWLNTTLVGWQFIRPQGITSSLHHTHRCF